MRLLKTLEFIHIVEDAKTGSLTSYQFNLNFNIPHLAIHDQIKGWTIAGSHFVLFEWSKENRKFNQYIIVEYGDAFSQVLFPHLYR